jgi:hypothetical protein
MIKKSGNCWGIQEFSSYGVQTRGPVIVTYFLSLFHCRMTGGSEFESRYGHEFSFLHIGQTGSGTHPASYPMGIGSSFLMGKAPGAWSWPLTSKYCWGQENLSIHPSPHTSSCLHGIVLSEAQGQLYLLPLILLISWPLLLIHLNIIYSIVYAQYSLPLRKER